ncbi:MAG: glycine zipper 2TM domain-containing protein [Rhodocyclaceae bacterium]|nr:glycine zipper 2TM domain-containing protein [Rhodocyclaceae bacterium]
MSIRNYAIALMIALTLGACATNPFGGETAVRYGQITRIDTVEVDGDKNLGWGTVIGAVAGGLLGNQIGAGNGRTVATVAGAAAGGFAGTAVESKTKKQTAQHIFVHLSDGTTVGITQPASDLRVGEKVRIEGNGNSARVVR